ncbi:uncharacterized protein CEXT_98411 [Caerostris extrusa]|uniref:Uncharacterized protein n=1 Tax=Caerostris extrusa TaxID=172846 RepID=A0AAV4SZ47_CAEEX|nr:uncharacterized protein CEXT_98411 [Caerostris extrusa]
MIKYIILLAMAVASTGALYVCPENYCDRLICEDLSDCSESNGFKVKKQGSFCQCCDICVKILGENETCTTPGLRFAITSECAEGLVCPIGVGRCVTENWVPE